MNERHPFGFYPGGLWPPSGSLLDYDGEVYETQATRMSVGGEQTETTDRFFWRPPFSRRLVFASLPSLIIFTLSRRRPQVQAHTVVLFVEGLKVKTVVFSALSEQTLN